MSKAFTREDADVPPVLPLPPPAEPGEKRLVTAAGYRALQHELAQLQDVARPALQQAGGLEAQNRLQGLDARIAVLAARLAQLTVAEPPDDTDAVHFGAEVTVRNGRGATVRYRIVGPDEVDAARRHISVDSPIAQALLGHGAGETVDVELPRGDEELAILAVRY